jgi:hypothetical protein
MAFIFTHVLDYVGGFARDATFLSIVLPCIDIAVSRAVEGATILREGDAMAQLIEVSCRSCWMISYPCPVATSLTASLSTTVWVDPLCLTQAPSPVSCNLLMPCPCSTTKSPPAESNCKLRGSRKLFATTWTRNPGATEGAPCAGAMELGQAAAVELD